MSNESDDLDRAAELSEMWLQDRIHEALHGDPMNPGLGSKLCKTCGEPNDRPSRAQGWDTCIDCRETPGWHLMPGGLND